MGAHYICVYRSSRVAIELAALMPAKRPDCPQCQLLVYFGMTISITPQLEEFVKEQVAAGRYASSSEVVRAGLRLLQDQEADKAERQAALKKWVQEGIDDPEVVDAAAVHERMRKVIAAAASAPAVEGTVAGTE
jgi:antitoxin ParD1/3/4